MRDPKCLRRCWNTIPMIYNLIYYIIILGQIFSDKVSVKQTAALFNKMYCSLRFSLSVFLLTQQIFTDLQRYHLKTFNFRCKIYLTADTINCHFNATTKLITKLYLYTCKLVTSYIWGYCTYWVQKLIAADFSSIGQIGIETTDENPIRFENPISTTFSQCIEKRLN